MCSHCNIDVIMVPVSTVCWIVVASVLATFIISWFIFHHLWFKKTSYPKFCQRLEYCIEVIAYWLQRLWYAILLTGSSIYLFIHFEECCDLTFTSKFNGFNVIFVFWLFLLILPLFDKLEGFGLSFKLNHQTKVSTDVAAEAMNSDEIMSLEELNQMHREGGQNE